MTFIFIHTNELSLIKSKQKYLSAESTNFIQMYQMENSKSKVYMAMRHNGEDETVPRM